MRRLTLMLSLIVAGELVFGLAFNVPRFFRPTMLQAFELTNTQLGDMFAIYGLTAIVSYFPGGALADHFTARSLISISLFATAAGGIYMATFPSNAGMAVLYGYWGVTTIFLFWGALIRATRDWGGDQTQGVAFGLLEGGRGLAAASVAFLGVSVLGSYMPVDANLATVDEREAGFRAVILLYTVVTFLSGLLAWFAIPATPRPPGARFDPLRGMSLVLKKPVVWALSAIIVCAYCGYKGLDNYSLYAYQVLGRDEVEAARLTTYGAWTRPISALLAGVIADRFTASRSIVVMFMTLCASYALWASLAPDAPLVVILANFFLTYIFVYALRGVYFALVQDIRTPMNLTGAAVGLASLVGFSPDFFFAPITGRILDANPGIVGFQHYFLFLAAIAFVGLIAISWLIWLRRRGDEHLWRTAEQGAKYSDEASGL